MSRKRTKMSRFKPSLGRAEIIDMKKIFRCSQIKDVLGRQVHGLDMHKYGLTYDGALGTFFPEEDPDRIDLMLAAAERYFPEIHVTSILKDGRMLNRYVENADLYCLYRGNTDPEIEFTTEMRKSDSTEEENEQVRLFYEANKDIPPTPAEIAAVDWMLKKIMSPKKVSK